MDALAVFDARELAFLGIEISIIVPGAFTKGTNHLAHAVAPADKQRLAAYEAGPFKGYGKKSRKPSPLSRQRTLTLGLSQAIVKVVDAPFGKRPFRVHIDPTQDGAEVAFGIIDRVRTEMLHRGRLEELLTPVKR